uniref:Uncharacterized protein n=1 Tax=Anguilla anguilla TaxID=7936 RepID=A0A0E9PUN3_ANGAN
MQGPTKYSCSHIHKKKGSLDLLKDYLIVQILNVEKNLLTLYRQ